METCYCTYTDIYHMATNLLKPLTVQNTKPTGKDQRLSDGGGLYLLVKPNGAKWWRFDYSIAGKRKCLSLGVYPVTSLADARRKAEDARKEISNGINPSDTRKYAKQVQLNEVENSRRKAQGLPIENSELRACKLQPTDYFGSHSLHALHGKVTLKSLAKKIKKQ